MPVLAWLLSNWKVVAVASIVAMICGYIWFLRADVARHEKNEQQLRADMEVVQKDLEAAKYAIVNMRAGWEDYRLLVDAALENVKAVQARIGRENKLLQGRLDNVASAAREAKRIENAPIIPFFSDLVGMDNGVYRYRVRTPAP